MLELALLSHDDSSSSIVEALLEYGANPNLFLRQPGASDQEGTQGDAGVKVVAGENQGATVASPLHLLCSTEDIKQVIGTYIYGTERLKANGWQSAYFNLGMQFCIHQLSASLFMMYSRT